jgi:hypothetical protein
MAELTSDGNRALATSEQNIRIYDGINEEQFVAARIARDKAMPMPTLLLPSVQVNIRAGHMPQQAPSG